MEGDERVGGDGGMLLAGMAMISVSDCAADLTVPSGSAASATAE